MFCSSCGAERENSGKYCSSCGLQFPSETLEAELTSNSDEPMGVSETKQGMSSKTGALLALAAVGVIAAIGIGFAFFGGNLTSTTYGDEAVPLSDDELDREAFGECLMGTEIFALLDESEALTDDIAATFDNASLTSVSSIERTLRNLSGFGREFVQLSGRFYSMPNCGSRTFGDFATEAGDIYAELGRNLSDIPTNVDDFVESRVADRIVNNLEDGGELFFEQGLWFSDLSIEVD